MYALFILRKRFFVNQTLQNLKYLVQNKLFFQDLSFFNRFNETVLVIFIRIVNLSEYEQTYPITLCLSLSLVLSET